MILLNKAKNYATNGAFDFWQRGTSFAAIANNVYFADRFQYAKSGTMVHTVSRSSDNLNSLVADYSARFQVTTAQASINASDRCFFLQKVEGLIYKPIKGRKQVLKFKVKAFKTGVYCVAFRNADVTRSLVKEYTINSSNVEQIVEIPFRHEDIGTWDYGTGTSVIISFIIAAGSDFHTTPDVWQDGNFLATVNQVNGVDSISNDFYVTEIQLEEGSEGSNFERAGGNYANELALCQRYYQKHDTTRRRVVSSIMFDGFELPVAMRIFPVGTGTISDNGTLTISDPAPSNPIKSTIQIQGSANATSNGAHIIAFNLDAEL